MQGTKHPTNSTSKKTKKKERLWRKRKDGELELTEKMRIERKNKGRRKRFQLACVLSAWAGVRWLTAHKECAATWASPTLSVPHIHIHPHTNTHFVKYLPAFLETAADRTRQSHPPTSPIVSSSFMLTPTSSTSTRTSSPPFHLPHLSLIFRLHSSNHFHLSSSSSAYNFTSSWLLQTSLPPSPRHFAPHTLAIYLPLSHLPRSYQNLLLLFAFFFSSKFNLSQVFLTRFDVSYP